MLRGVKTKGFLFTLRLSYSRRAVHRAFRHLGAGRGRHVVKALDLQPGKPQAHLEGSPVTDGFGRAE
jgi:hypothetical protein